MRLAISHYEYRVRDLELMTRFYCDVIGLREAYNYTDDQGKVRGVCLQVSDSTMLELWGGATGEQPTDRSRIGITRIGWWVDDINAVLAEWGTKGVVADRPPTIGADNVWHTGFRDPEGNSIELWQSGGDSKQEHAIAAWRAERGG